MKLNHLTTAFCLVAAMPAFALMEPATPESQGVSSAALADAIRAALVAAKCRMIERAAKVACDVCLADAKVWSATVTVTKAGAIPRLASASAVFSAEK